MTFASPLSPLGPRTQPHSGSPGSYEVAVRVAKPLLAPGEVLEVDFFFTGYGEISQPKLYFFPSSSAFDIAKCTVRSGLALAPDGLLTWGTEASAIPANGPLFISFHGLKHKDWPESTCFADAATDTNLVLTEASLGGHAPVELRFPTLRSIEPGKYYIELAFSYYDGQKWRSAAKRVEFTVASFLERHQRKLAWYGIAASLLGLGASIARYF